LKNYSRLFAVTLVCCMIVISIPLVLAKPNRGYLYYEGDIVRTFVPNGKPLNKEGTDPLYAFTNGIEGQYSVIKYAPGDKEYHGGHWKVFKVTWIARPRVLLTSYNQLMRAENAGLVEIVRDPSADVLCPVQPGSMWNGNSNTPA
jgi:hypothetical protein